MALKFNIKYKYLSRVLTFGNDSYLPRHLKIHICFNQRLERATQGNFVDLAKMSHLRGCVLRRPLVRLLLIFYSDPMILFQLFIYARNLINSYSFLRDAYKVILLMQFVYISLSYILEVF